uniref:WD repeat-containing protein 81-like isoform X2 n=1 Tax=Myxine glutinosa TaxID=7769 RepID=UPI00358FAF03
MAFQASCVQRDLGIAGSQLADWHGNVLAYVPEKWLREIKEGCHPSSSCPKPEGLWPSEIGTLLQRSITRLPTGWTRICIQVILKRHLEYDIVGDCLSTNPLENESNQVGRSFLHFMHSICTENYRNRWKDAPKRYPLAHQPIAEHKRCTLAVNVVKEALQKLYELPFLLISSGDTRGCTEAKRTNVSEIKASRLNVVEALALLESEDVLYILQPFPGHSLHDVITFSPAKLANSHAKVLFVLYQVLQAMVKIHHSGLACGSLTLRDIFIDERLCIKVSPRIADYEKNSMAPSARNIDRSAMSDGCKERVQQQIDDVDADGDDDPVSDRKDLVYLVAEWVHGKCSNFDYLMELNRLAGRRMGDPNYHPVLPWVIDFTVPYGKFRDLSKSKYRLNKGDDQLDFTYTMNKEASTNSSLENVHVSHHISDVLSDITYYVYKARQTRKEVLCMHVRSKWEPNEYPSSIGRLQSWTPDECIPEFFCDPEIFRSVHPDMPDLQIPSWCTSYQDFVEKHRFILESIEVSENLHTWIDLTFGYKLSGKESIRAKNVCLHLVDKHTNLSSYGVVQLFDVPHPRRRCNPSIFMLEPPFVPHLQNYASSASKDVIVDTQQPFNADHPETVSEELDIIVEKACAVVEDDGSFEQATEALDDLDNGKMRTATLQNNTSVLSGIVGGKKPKGETGESEASSTIKFSLPEEFNPLQVLDEFEALCRFTVSVGLCEPKTLKREVKVPDILQSDFVHRDMQAFGVLVAELCFAAKLRTMRPEATLIERYKAVRKLLRSCRHEIALPVRYVVEMLLQANEDPELLTDGICVFKYDIVIHGLPPPTPTQILSPHLDIIPFPSYFPALYKFAVNFQISQMQKEVDAMPEFVQGLKGDLPEILEILCSEGVEIFLPFFVFLMSDNSVSVLTIQHLFEPISKALGPINTSKYLQRFLVAAYENCCAGHDQLCFYEDQFVEKLMSCLGLSQFLQHVFSHIIHVVAGFEKEQHSEEDEVGTAVRSRVLLHMQSIGETGSNTPEIAEDTVAGGAVVGPEGELDDFSVGMSFTHQDMLVDTISFTGTIFGVDDPVVPKASDSTSQESNKSSGSEVSCEADKDVGVNLQLGNENDGGLPVGNGEVEGHTDMETDAQDTCLEANTMFAGEMPCAVDVEENGETAEPQDISNSDVKKLIRTACSMVRTQIGRLGPTLSSKYVARTLLRILSFCYLGSDKHQYLCEEMEGESQVGIAAYQAQQVSGDRHAEPVLHCLIHLAFTYGEPVLTLQYIPHISYLVSCCSGALKLNPKREAGLLGAVVLLQCIVPYLSDVSLVDCLWCIIHDALLPILHVFTSSSISFPSGVQCRSVLCQKSMSLMMLICLRIGVDSVQRHMSEALSAFFQGFSIAAEGKGDQCMVRDHGVGEADNEHPGMEEMRKVFNAELASAAYVPFLCLLGNGSIEESIPNRDLVCQLSSQYEQELLCTSDTPPVVDVPEDPVLATDTTAQSSSILVNSDDFGSFGGFSVGNRIQIRSGPTGDCETVAVRLSQLSNSYSVLSLSGSPSQALDDGLVKQELRPSERVLAGNWLAHWQYDIGLSHTQGHFNFNQVKLQVRHTLGMVVQCGHFVSGPTKTFS